MNKTKILTDTEILEQLARVLESDEFHRSLRSSSFLEFIVRQSLAGKSDQLKGYTIAIMVFGKSDDFDPDTDASVRVEATRLRKALALYYHGAGRHDPVVIKVPKGSYRPVFHYNDHPALPGAGEQAEGLASHSLYRSMRYPALLLLLILLVAVLSFSSVFLRDAREYGVVKTRLPVILVLPLNSVGDQTTDQISVLLSNKLSYNLSLFRSVETSKAKVNAHAMDGLENSTIIGEKFKANYVLVGSVRKYINEVNAVVHLLDVQRKTYIWSYNEKYDLQPGNDEWIEDFSGKVASQLASPYAVIQNNEQQRIRQTLTDEGYADYKCFLDFYVYSNNKTAAQHKMARDCLEVVVENDPQNSNGWAYLSWIYGDEFRYNYNKSASDEAVKARSLQAALRAVEADPQNPSAHQYLANAYHLDDDTEKMLEQLKISVELNPYDSEVLADAAWNYGQIGEWEKSGELGLRAVRLNPDHARWYHGILFAYFYMDGNYQDATYHALEYYQPDVLFANVALAVSYAGQYEYDKAAEVARFIEENFPEFIESPRQALEGWNFQKPFIDKILIGAQDAGVNFSE